MVTSPLSTGTGEGWAGSCFRVPLLGRSPGNRIFDECIDPIREPDDARWDELVIRELTARGYVVKK